MAMKINPHQDQDSSRKRLQGQMPAVESGEGDTQRCTDAHLRIQWVWGRCYKPWVIGKAFAGNRGVTRGPGNALSFSPRAVESYKNVCSHTETEIVSILSLDRVRIWHSLHIYLPQLLDNVLVSSSGWLWTCEDTPALGSQVLDYISEPQDPACKVIIKKRKKLKVVRGVICL